MFATQLDPDRKDSTRPALLRALHSAHPILAQGGDIALSPDNIDVSAEYLMLWVGGTAQSRLTMVLRCSDGSI